jgi:acetyl esterase/lipase
MSIYLPFSVLTRFHLYDLQVVSPDQATKIYKAIKEKGLPVALVEYEGEQHGFRKVYDYPVYPPHLLCQYVTLSLSSKTMRCSIEFNTCYYTINRLSAVALYQVTLFNH